MTLDPFKPPTGWDRDPPPANDDGPWTVGKVLRVMGRAFRKQPIAVFLAVCVLPGLWTVPTSIAHDVLISDDEPFFGPGRSLVAAAVSLGSAAWDSVWYAGQLSAAIAAVRGQPIRWRAFVEGLSRAPVLFLSFALVIVPFELVGLLPIEVQRGEMFSAFDAAGLLVMVYIGARTCLWAPILVDTRVPFFEGLKESWAMTWGAVTRLVLLVGILIAVTVPIAFVELSFSDGLYVFIAVISALFSMTVATLYTFVYPEPSR